MKNNIGTNYIEADKHKSVSDVYQNASLKSDKDGVNLFWKKTQTATPGQPQSAHRQTTYCYPSLRDFVC